jgi:hypothetical protein
MAETSGEPGQDDREETAIGGSTPSMMSSFAPSAARYPCSERRHVPGSWPRRISTHPWCAIVLIGLQPTPAQAVIARIDDGKTSAMLACITSLRVHRAAGSSATDCHLARGRQQELSAPSMRSHEALELSVVHRSEHPAICLPYPRLGGNASERRVEADRGQRRLTGVRRLLANAESHCGAAADRARRFRSVLAAVW